LRISEIAIQNRESLIEDENLERERERKRNIVFYHETRSRKRKKRRAKEERILLDSLSHCYATLCGCDIRDEERKEGLNRISSEMWVEWGEMLHVTTNSWIIWL
jgi:hypothetical protein